MNRPRFTRQSRQTRESLSLLTRREFAALRAALDAPVVEPADRPMVAAYVGAITHDADTRAAWLAFLAADARATN